MAAVSCRQDAVKEIHAAFYRLQNIFRCTNAHQVSRLLLRQIRHNLIQNTIHFRMGFPYRKTADGIAIQLHLGNPFCMLDTDILEGCPLVNAEQHLLGVDGILQLIQAVHLFFAAFQPTGCSGNGCLYIRAFRRQPDTFIKRHRNRGAKVGLNLHTFLRPHKNLSAINMRAEINALLLDFAQKSKGEYLKAAGIG